MLHDKFRNFLSHDFIYILYYFSSLTKTKEANDYY